MNVTGVSKYPETPVFGGYMVIHNIPPVFDENSRILILGSFPSVKSREMQFFYGHPQNRFWKLLARLFNDDVPADIPDKRSFLLRNRVAVWDVVKSCEIKGSEDCSITDVTVNDLSIILGKCDISQIFCNGGTSFSLYKKYCADKIGRPAVKLPSTSPANAAYSIDRLCEQWKIILTTDSK